MRIRELIAAYLDSRVYRRIGKEAKQNYLLLLKTLPSGWLQTEISNVKEADADAFYARLQSEGTLYRANATIAILHMLWAFGVRQGFVTGNPWSQMKLVQPPQRVTIWSKEQFQLALDTCDKFETLTPLKLLLQMCYYLGQRPSDCLNVPCANLNGEFLTIVQGKTKKMLHVYVPEVLRERLNEIKTTIMPGTEGNPRYPETFFSLYPHSFKTIYNRHFVEMRNYSHLPKELQIRDLRRTAVTELADAEATDAEIIATSGHSPNSDVMANVYRLRTAIQSRNGQLKRFGIKKKDISDIDEDIVKIMLDL